jgi:hypothetical protein
MMTGHPVSHEQKFAGGARFVQSRLFHTREAERMGSWIAGVNVVYVLSATKQARKIAEGIEEECENRTGSG